jgi:ribosomal protein L11 methyltransferase
MRIKMSVFQMKIPVDIDAAELAGVLACPEFLGAWEADGSLVLYWKTQGQDILRQVRAAINTFGAEVPEEAIQFHPVIDEDWNAQWAALVQPVLIGRRIGIRPSWAAMDLPDDGIELVIDPKQAFGTGHHATTQLILEWLEEVTWHPGMRVLDVGTGSGILAMAALRLGATTALGIEVDSTALEHAREYAAINHFHRELDLRCCRIETLPAQPYDILLANLDRQTLLDISGEFVKMREAHTQLVVSGLLEEDESEIVTRLETQGWMFQNVRRREGWIAIQLEEKSPGSSWEFSSSSG